MPRKRVLHLPNAVGKAPPADPQRDPKPDGETWTWITTWSSAQTPAHPAAGDARRVDHLDPRAEDQSEDRRAEDHPMDRSTEGHRTGVPPGGPPCADLPDKPPGADIPEDIWQWIAYPRKIRSSERQAQINKIEIGRSAADAAKAQKELDIVRFEAGRLSGVVTKLQKRLDRLEDLDLIQAGPVAAPKPLRVTMRPGAVAAPDRATPCPRGAAERRRGTNG